MSVDMCDFIATQFYDCGQFFFGLWYFCNLTETTKCNLGAEKFRYEFNFLEKNWNWVLEFVVHKKVNIYKILFVTITFDTFYYI